VADETSKFQVKFQQLRDRHEWLDHIVRAGARYTERNGDYYAAAVTYFSVLSLVPLLMIAFAVAGFVLRAHPVQQSLIVFVVENPVPKVERQLIFEFLYPLQIVRRGNAVLLGR